MINLDMIGHLRNDRLIVLGSRSGVGWRRLLSTHNDGPGLNLDFSWSMEDLSDHSPFFESNIPVLLLTTGEHADYHRPTDDANRIDHAGMRRVVQLAFGTLCDLADAPQTPHFRPLAKRETEKVRKQLADRNPVVATSYRRSRRNRSRRPPNSTASRCGWGSRGAWTTPNRARSSLPTSCPGRRLPGPG